MDCNGLGVDGASVMVGERNSVWTKVKQLAPNCIQLRYISHSMALCIKVAFNELPSAIGYILNAFPRWLKKSGRRRDAYQQVFKVMNADEESRVDAQLHSKGMCIYTCLLLLLCMFICLLAMLYSLYTKHTHTRT